MDITVASQFTISVSVTVVLIPATLLAILLCAMLMLVLIMVLRRIKKQKSKTCKFWSKLGQHVYGEIPNRAWGGGILKNCICKF